MADQRLHRILSLRQTAQGDDFFGDYELIGPEGPGPLAPVKRVAILTEAFLPKVDGVSKTTYLTVRYLQETGREVLIFAPDTSIPRVGESEVVPIPSFSMAMASETRVALPSPYILRRIREFKPDLIHLCSPALMSVSGMVAGRDLNVPVVANYQTDLPGYAVHYGAPLLEKPVRNWLRYLHNGCHINLAPSRPVMRQLRQWGFRRLRLWGRGVNIKRFNPSHYSATMRERLLNGRNPDSLLIVYLGRLANEKCVELLREVADVPGVALTIIGDGHRREALEQLFAGTGTHFTGYMFGDELSTALASADAFFFTGPNETFGQVVQEALASGLPVVATHRGSVGDLVEPGRTGFVVEHRASAFAQAAEHLAADRELVRQMARHARAFAETRPWSAIMQELEGHYREAYQLNQRWKRQFGWTTYHTPAVPASALATAGIYIASNVWRR